MNYQPNEYTIRAKMARKGALFASDEVGLLLAEIDRLHALAAPPEGWQKIASAPKDGTRILWCADNGPCMKVRWVFEVISWPNYAECFDSGYWMPLPPSPLAGQENER